MVCALNTGHEEGAAPFTQFKPDITVGNKDKKRLRLLKISFQNSVPMLH
jgi:hypothetical protein